MRDIGREGGFTQGTIYNYVRSKSDILYLVCDEVVRDYQEAVARAVDGVSDPARRLSGAVHAVVTVLHEHQDAILLLYQESHALDRKSLEGVLGRVSEYIEMFERLLAEAAREGRIPPLDARLAANIVTFLPTIVALRRWDLAHRMSRDALLRGVTDFLLRGLGAAPEALAPATPPERPYRRPAHRVAAGRAHARRSTNGSGRR